MKRDDLIKYLDQYLEIDKYSGLDASLNGLQLGNDNREIKHLCFAVDASMKSIEKAIENNADILIVHHGLFWGSPLSIKGTHFDKVKKMIDNKLDLYAAHLPLDASEKVGHNFTMANRLKLKEIQSEFSYKGINIGCCGILENPLSLEEIAEILEFTNPIFLDFNKKPIMSIGIVSGEGAHDIKRAKEIGCDLLITGEPRHSEYHWCEEEEISMLCGGHYESEVFGLFSLSSVLVKKFDIAISFISDPTGL